MTGKVDKESLACLEKDAKAILETGFDWSAFRAAEILALIEKIRELETRLEEERLLESL